MARTRWMRPWMVVFSIFVLSLTGRARADETDDMINQLISQMTLDEKIALIHGNTNFSVAGIPRLGIPERWLDDGPMGVREETVQGFELAGHSNDFSTAMPATLGLAASWNPELAYQFGAVIGQEAKARGKNIMLGPSLNIQRTPLGGRSFEYMGEDPFLTGRIAVGYIHGEQAQGTGSTAKHYAANNQEYQRGTINVTMDERTLREIYLPAFEAAVREGGVLCIMGAYNRFRGQYCCENPYLLQTILKDEWGFKGLVMTDWGAAHNTKNCATSGLDLEMGSRVVNGSYDNFYMAKPLEKLVQSGEVPMSAIDDKVRRNLWVMAQLHMIGAPPTTSPTSQPSGSLNTPQHEETARKVQEEAIVLLKNQDSLLPLDGNKVHSIAVIGDNAVVKYARGGGSATIKSFYEVTPLEGIINRAAKTTTVTFAQGYVNPVPPQFGRGRGGRRGGPTTGPGAGPGRGTTQPAFGGFPPATQPDVPLNSQLVAQAIAAAKAADVVIFVGGNNHNPAGDVEGADRRDLSLPSHQAELISQIVAANPHTIVVIVSGGAVDMPWLESVPAVVEAWYGGMEAGNALARVLFGDVNPSGKLPCTFPKQLSDSPAHALGAYPGSGGQEEYKEGLLVGYRWYDTKQIEPMFPFGFGLSYTKFDYSNIKIVPSTDSDPTHIAVQCDITNSGERAGAEIAELYVSQVKSALPRPQKELKGFSKVFIEPGKTRTVTINLNQRSFAYYDPDKKGWIAEQGDYVMQIGASSRDIRQQVTYALSAESVTH